MLQYVSNVRVQIPSVFAELLQELLEPSKMGRIQRILGNPGLQRGRDGKGETESGKKVGGGEGKGKRKGEALGSFSIQIISRSITFLSRYWPHF